MAGFLKKLTGNEEENEQENFTEDVEYGINDILDDEQEVELLIDLYEDNDNLFLKAFIPGVEPKDVDIDVFRDKIVISGERVEKQNDDFDYFVQELPWGNFKKQVSLPKEINIEKIKSSTKNGLLVLKLPKTDKNRMVKISLD